MRIMGLDVGTKRIGVALSDELFITAQGSATIERKTLESDLEEIKRVARENSVEEIVVGLPISMNGSYSEQTRKVVEFKDSLSKAVDIPVVTWDERLTTVQAERTLLEADVSRAKRRKAIDKLAAQAILQNFLDSRKRG
ncbi:MAG: Holliday junction resolvase RuvX [Candidatus Omnitrophota bacterium]